MAERTLTIDRSTSGPQVPISNSHKSRGEKKEEPTDIIPKEAVRPKAKSSLDHDNNIKKESKTEKLKKALFGESVENVGDYMIFQVMIPALKATFADMIGNGIEVWLFGESSGRRRGPSRNSERAGYSGMYRRDSSREREDRDSDLGYVWEQVEPMSKSDCLTVLSDLKDYAFDNEYATVADLLDIMRMSKYAEFTDENKGWYAEDLKGNNATYRAVRGGYVLDLPRPRRVGGRR